MPPALRVEVCACSEYLDKGADFGHTLWAIRPDGTHPELIFGNNTLNCYANGHEVPLEWLEIVTATGKTAPYIGEVLAVGFSMAQAVVVLFTPDDEARLRSEHHKEGEPSYESDYWVGPAECAV
jgi:hypothetical protein